MPVRAVQHNSVVGFLHEPDQPNQSAIMLTHGAGANCNSPLLVRLASRFADLGFSVLRCDLPFRQKKIFGPPFPAQATADREGLREAVLQMRAIAPKTLYLGGHSYGGRQATILASEDPTIADALLLLSYPLHPPKKPSDLRTAHFPALKTPCFFAHGTNDPFGSPQEMNAALSLITAPHQFLAIERAGHDLMKGDPQIAELMTSAFCRFITASGHV